MTEKTASTEKVGQALTQAPTNRIQPGMGLKALLATDTIKARFSEVLGKKAPGFISSIITATQLNPKLQACDPTSVISSAAIAASLDLPINSSLGFAHIVPYKGVAQFQMGWKGFVQLAMRSGQYLTLNVAEVYEGQLRKANPFTGLMDFDADGKKSDKVIGYVAYERLLNGFEKFLYITTEDARAHGKKFSQAFKSGFGPWVDDFDAMAKKTVIKALLSKWGILSIEMQKAIETDQAAIDTDGNPTYIDVPAGTEGREMAETGAAPAVDPAKAAPYEPGSDI